MIKHRKRRQRLATVLAIIVGAASATGFVLYALGQNLNLYYTPKQLQAEKVPLQREIRLGGLVAQHSVQHGQGLQVSFVLVDVDGSRAQVRYNGMLPNLFREGQGIIAEGKLITPNVLVAEQVLAKHDENYRPPS